MRKLLLCFILVLCLPLAACALTLPYRAETVLTVQDLTPAQSALAEHLYTPIFNMEESITLPKGTRYEDAEAAMTALTRDYPELFHLGRNYSLSYYAHAPEYATAVIPQYRMSAEEAAAKRAELYVAAYLAVAENPDPLALHDHVCAVVTYGSSTEMAHTAVGALLEGQATCEGYAQALTLLYRMAGVPCGIVTGTAVDSQGRTDRHAWNIADIDGYCLIDATWNDQEHLGLNTHWYYGLSSRQMAKDHTPDAELSLPLCDDHTLWHRLEGSLISTIAEADATLHRLIRGETVNLRFTDEALYRSLAHSASLFLDGYNERNPDAPFYGSYSMTVSDAQQCIILQRGK